MALFLDYSIVKSIGKFDQKKKHDKNAVVFEVITIISIIGVLSYLGRNIIEKIPFPLNGVAGFQHSRLKEAANIGFITSIMIMTTKSLQERVGWLGENYRL